MFEQIKKSISVFNNSIKNPPPNYTEHYVGIIVDNNKRRYYRMKKLYESLSSNDKLKLKFDILKYDINRWKSVVDEPTLDNKSIDDLSLNELINMKYELTDDKTNNIKKINTDLSNIFSGITDYYQGKGLSNYMTSVKSYNKHVGIDKSVYNPEVKLTNEVLLLFKQRKTILDYFKQHFTYVFIGKDKTFTFLEKSNGYLPKNLPLLNCKKNCIYNSQNLNEALNNTSTKYIKSNDNTEILKLINIYDRFPLVLSEYLTKLGISKEDRRILFKSGFNPKNTQLLKEEYCKCNTDTYLSTDADSYGCYKGYENEIFNNNTKCGPVSDNLSFVETFTGNSQIQLDKKQLKDDMNNSVKEINNSYKMNNYYLRQLKHEHTDFRNLDKKYSKNKRVEKKLGNSDRVYSQMIKDNLLVSNRYTLIRYLIIMFLIFSILLIMKYINIV